MTILQSLVRYYDRLPDVAKPGWSYEKFGWCIVLDAGGKPVDVENLHDTLSGKKPKVTLHAVPAALKRTVAIAPNFLWDKTAYVLGRTAGTSKRTAEEHAAFVAMHRERLAGSDDPGLLALRRFLDTWQPDQFEALPHGGPDMLDANVMFRLEGERGYIHERPAARALFEAKEPAGAQPGQFCLITGEQGPVARLHPTIKGVDGAQSSGAALVSFNLDAFTSLGKEQGENAPTSEAAAFRYGAALNQLLTRGGPNRLRRPIGDATVVFWADARDAKAAEAADKLFGGWMENEVTDEKEAEKVRAEMEQVATGRPVADLRADIDPATRFHVLGLSPNAARLSVRFWLTDSFDHFARALAQHYQDLRVDPLPRDWGAAPSVNRLLAKSTAAQGDVKNVPPLLAGEVMRAVLIGTRYPQSLLATAVMRLRAGDPKTKDGKPASIGWHAAVIRAVLQRDARLSGRKDGVPMSLDEANTDEAYRLGRLFAALEYLQEKAIEGIKASIRTRFLASASAAPASVFPTLLRLSQHHIVKLSSMTGTGAATFHDKQIQQILEDMPPAFPRSLKLADQGRFYIGYYHQRAERFRKRDGAPSSEEHNDGE